MKYHDYVLGMTLCFSCLFGYEGLEKGPYLTDDTWRYFADWRLSKDEEFNPEDVKLGDTIFVEHDLLKKFGRKYLSKIKNRFVLITLCGESSAENLQMEKYSDLLDSQKIASWFVQNMDREPSEKIIPIPIGLANQQPSCEKVADQENLYASYWHQKVFNLQKKIRENPTLMERVHAWFSR